MKLPSQIVLPRLVAARAMVVAQPASASEALSVLAERPAQQHRLQESLAARIADGRHQNRLRRHPQGRDRRRPTSAFP